MLAPTPPITACTYPCRPTRPCFRAPPSPYSCPPISAPPRLAICTQSLLRQLRRQRESWEAASATFSPPREAPRQLASTRLPGRVMFDMLGCRWRSPLSVRLASSSCYSRVDSVRVADNTLRQHQLCHATAIKAAPFLTRGNPFPTPVRPSPITSANRRLFGGAVRWRGWQAYA